MSLRSSAPALQRSTFYTHRTRTWRWARSRCSWKARTRRPPAPGRLTRCTTAPGLPPRTPSYARRSPGSPLGAPPSCRRRTRPAAGLTQTCPPPSPEPGVPTTGGRSSGKTALATPCSSSSSRPAGTRGGSWGSAPPTSMGQHPYPAPPSRRPRREQSTHLPANTGGHRRYGGRPSAAPPDTTRRPPGAQGPGPRPRLGVVARRVGRVAPLPPLPMPMDGRRPPAVQG